VIMRKYQELSDPGSCLNRAAENELTFVLLARDPAATVAVRFWIEERIRIGQNARNDPQIVEAERWIETASRERAECPGHGRGGRKEACCERAGEYNGFGSDGPLLFRCPNGCGCHD
jgi:hypothetical protein